MNFFPAKHICIDFDGVIHSYTSGWQGNSTISDPPVPGAFEFLLTLIENNYLPCIYSSRSRSFFGRRAMKKWLHLNISSELLHFCLRCHAINVSVSVRSMWQFRLMNNPKFQSSNFNDIVKNFIKYLKFPIKKPAAYLTLDDRAICFTGDFPTIKELNDFKPWYK